MDSFSLILGTFYSTYKVTWDNVDLIIGCPYNLLIIITEKSNILEKCVFSNVLLQVPTIRHHGYQYLYLQLLYFMLKYYIN